MKQRARSSDPEVPRGLQTSAAVCCGPRRCCYTVAGSGRVRTSVSLRLLQMAHLRWGSRGDVCLVCSWICLATFPSAPAPPILNTHSSEHPLLLFTGVPSDGQLVVGQLGLRGHVQLTLRTRHHCRLRGVEQQQQPLPLALLCRLARRDTSADKLNSLTQLNK